MSESVLKNKIYDVVIVGGGPAAYTAALFLKKKNTGIKLMMLVGGYDLEIGPGGQLTTTTTVDNYPGFPKGVQGPDLMETMEKQARKEGIEIVEKTVSLLTKVNENKDLFVLCTDKKYEKTEILNNLKKNIFGGNDQGMFLDQSIKLSKSVIVATGASANKLHCKNTDVFWNKGISACAVCDGFMFKDKKVVVIGGGDTAMEETSYLSNICKEVVLVHRRNEFRAREDNLEKVKEIKNVSILTPYELESCHGESVLKSIKIKNNLNDEKREITTDGLFFAIGHTPNTSFISIEGVNILENKFLKTENEVLTNISGLFACGDVQDFVYRQGITAAGSGCKAALACLSFLSKQ
ncbi:TRR1 [Ecytonucleospora hepatopenaei]|uniref:TRR1 n=1 Tax=Ecytonucleospora hepatopenaei TaxID=646526 RepID=A0A1W0E6F0_9MICR|nr:TRR1 [Ecytonucleospora hepatopenaei]